MNDFSDLLPIDINTKKICLLVLLSLDNILLSDGFLFLQNYFLNCKVIGD